MNIIRANSRGKFRNEWLESYHSFSFGDYYDMNRMGFSSLRVINDDRIAPRGGFPMHGHRDMEIITYVLAGALSHRDSLGTGSAIHPGEVQRMSAGSGIRHSEFNHSDTEAVHLLQIWILPVQTHLKPGYAQAYFPLEERQGKLRLVASPNGEAGSLGMNTDTNLYASILQTGESVQYSRPANRSVYIQIARGEVLLNGAALQAGDGVAVQEEQDLTLTTGSQGEFLLFDLPPVH